MQSSFEKQIANIVGHVVESAAAHPLLPDPDIIQACSNNKELLENLQEKGVGEKKAIDHVVEDILPGLNGASTRPNYYGFVTGGVTPAARVADYLATTFDQNVHVHLPEESICTLVEDRALVLLLELLRLDPTLWTGRIFTTGATASNVQGLACGRESVVQAFADHAAAQVGAAPSVVSVGELGLLGAFAKLQTVSTQKLCGIQVLTTLGHSSSFKAASIVGIGRASVKDVGQEHEPWLFDLAKLERGLQDRSFLSIVVVSCGEVNTGKFATRGRKEIQQIRSLCDAYRAWLHVDGAFGLFSRILEGTEFDLVKEGAEGVELADSITGDCHKFLNVPYDCGFFLSRHPGISQRVFMNANAAYLATTETNTIPSPLNIGLENSRRFRALPVYATLRAYGRDGHMQMLARQVRLARSIATFLHKHDDFELLPRSETSTLSDILSSIYIVVLFRAKDNDLNQSLVKRINATRKIYVSGTKWDGAPAARFAISNWQTEPLRDASLIKDVLEGVAASFAGASRS